MQPVMTAMNVVNERGSLTLNQKTV